MKEHHISRINLYYKPLHWYLTKWPNYKGGHISGVSSLYCIHISVLYYKGQMIGFPESLLIQLILVADDTPGELRIERREVMRSGKEKTSRGGGKDEKMGREGWKRRGKAEWGGEERE